MTTHCPPNVVACDLVNDARSVLTHRRVRPDNKNGQVRGVAFLRMGDVPEQAPVLLSLPTNYDRTTHRDHAREYGYHPVRYGEGTVRYVFAIFAAAGIMMGAARSSLSRRGGVRAQPQARMQDSPPSPGPYTGRGAPCTTPRGRPTMVSDGPARDSLHRGPARYPRRPPRRPRRLHHRRRPRPTGHSRPPVAGHDGRAGRLDRLGGGVHQ